MSDCTPLTNDAEADAEYRTTPPKIVARARTRRLRSIPVPAKSKPDLPRTGATVVPIAPRGVGGADDGLRGSGTPKGAA